MGPLGGASWARGPRGPPGAHSSGTRATLGRVPRDSAGDLFADSEWQTFPDPRTRACGAACVRYYCRALAVPALRCGAAEPSRAEPSRAQPSRAEPSRTAPRVRKSTAPALPGPAPRCSAPQAARLSRESRSARTGYWVVAGNGPARGRPLRVRGEARRGGARRRSRARGGAGWEGVRSGRRKAGGVTTPPLSAPPPPLLHRRYYCSRSTPTSPHSSHRYYHHRPPPLASSAPNSRFDGLTVRSRPSGPKHNPWLSD